MNFSMNLGLGVAIPVGKDELTFDFRNNLGLVDMMDKPAPFTTKNFQFFLGYSFPFPGRRL